MLYRMWSLVLWLKLPHLPPSPNKRAQRQTEPPSEGERKKPASCEDELTSDEADASGEPGRDKDWELAEEAVKRVRTPQ